MFSPDIVSSEEFLNMPVSSRELYFQLGMHADDDGFIQPKLIMRLAGASDDDLKVLLTKRFLLSFKSGVVVIKHWLIHNMIRSDRYKPTRFQEEKKNLIIKENKAYTDGLHSGNHLATQVRLGKVRLGKVSISAKAEINSSKKTKKEVKYDPLGAEIIKAFEAVDPKNKTMYGNTTQRKACDFLLKEFGLDKVLRVIEALPQINTQKLYIAQITTPYELQMNWVKLGNILIQKKGEVVKLKDKIAF